MLLPKPATLGPCRSVTGLAARLPKTPQVIRLLKKKKLGRILRRKIQNKHGFFSSHYFCQVFQSFLEIFRNSEFPHWAANLADRKWWGKTLPKKKGGFVAFEDLGGDEYKIKTLYKKQALKQALYKGWYGDVYHICLPNRVTDDFRTSQSGLIEICNEKMQNTVTWL